MKTLATPARLARGGLAALLAASIAASPALAAVPDRINFQGRLLDQDKLPRNGTFSMSFKICDSLAADCSSPVWSETQSIGVSNGVFSAQLGASSALSASVFSAANRYLEISVAGETLSPRERLVTAPYSFESAVAESLTSAANIAAGTLASARGGTGADLSGGAAGGVPYFSGAGVMSALGAGIAGEVLMSGGAGAPSWGVPATATALAADPSDCTLPNVALGIAANGTANCAQPSNVTGNAATASALAADPSDCTLPNVAVGISANGTATCAQPTNVSGSAASAGTAGTAGALAADPSDCSLPNVALGIAADGTASCAQPSNVTGNAATATALATARAINGTNFDGTAGITVPVNSADDTTGVSSVYPLWTSAVGNTAAKVSMSKLSFVPNTGVLTATQFAGSGAGLTSASVPDSALSSNVVLKDADSTITGSVIMSNSAAKGVLTLRAGAATAGDAPLYFVSGANLTNAEAGALEFDGAAYYRTVDTTNGRSQDSNQQIFRLTADNAAIGPGIADCYGANSAIPTATNGIYELTFVLYYTKTTAGTLTFTLTNTQTYTNLAANWANSAAGGMAASGGMLTAGVYGQTAAATALPATASLTNATNHHAVIRALAEIGTAGNVRLRCTESAGTITVRRGSYYTVRRLAGGNVGTFAP